MLRPGTIVEGRYRIAEPLGAGAMASVYRAELLSVQRAVALKVLESSMARDPSLRRRFLAEARAASAAGHQGIIEVFDAGELPDGRPFLVMECLRGCNLYEALSRDGPMSLQRACRIIRDVAWAIHAAHRVGVVHRDLKGENIFLCDIDCLNQERIKVLDFGIAFPMQTGPRLTSPGLTVGTPEYMAPEMLQGATPAPTLDVYALGVLLFELLVGRPPFVSDFPLRVLTDKAMQSAPRLSAFRSDAPAEIEALVAQCLAIDPDQRPATAEEIAVRLDRWLERAAGPSTVQVRITPDGKKRRGWLIGGTAACSMLVGVMLAMFGSDPADPIGLGRPRLPTVAVSGPPPLRPFTVLPSSSQTGHRPSPVEPNETPGTFLAVSPEPMPSSTGSDPQIDPDTCRRRRRRAREARAMHDWAGLLRHTDSTGCWSSPHERNKLRAKALLEVGQFDRCLTLTESLDDPEARSWRQLCQARLDARP